MLERCSKILKATSAISMEELALAQENIALILSQYDESNNIESEELLAALPRMVRHLISLIKELTVAIEKKISEGDSEFSFGIDSLMSMLFESIPEDKDLLNFHELIKIKFILDLFDYSPYFFNESIASEIIAPMKNFYGAAVTKHYKLFDSKPEKEKQVEEYLKIKMNAAKIASEKHKKLLLACAKCKKELQNLISAELNNDDLEMFVQMTIPGYTATSVIYLSGYSALAREVYHSKSKDNTILNKKARTFLLQYYLLDQLEDTLIGRRQSAVDKIERVDKFKNLFSQSSSIFLEQFDSCIKRFFKKVLQILSFGLIKEKNPQVLPGVIFVGDVKATLFAKPKKEIIEPELQNDKDIPMQTIFTF